MTTVSWCGHYTLLHWIDWRAFCENSILIILRFYKILSKKWDIFISWFLKWDKSYFCVILFANTYCFTLCANPSTVICYVTPTGTNPITKMEVTHIISVCSKTEFASIAFKKLRKTYLLFVILPIRLEFGCHIDAAKQQRALNFELVVSNQLSSVNLVAYN